MAATQQPHAEESLADIGRQIADDASRLVRMEIELAKAGMVAILKRALVAVAMAVLALPVLIIGATLAFASLPKHFGDTWWAWAITGGGFLLLAGALGLVAALSIRAAIRQQKETVADIKEDVEWVKELTRRGTRSS